MVKDWPAWINNSDHSIECYTDKLCYNKNDLIEIFVNNKHINQKIDISLLNFNKKVLIKKHNIETKKYKSDISLSTAIEGCNWECTYKFSLKDIYLDLKIPNIYFLKVDNFKSYFYSPLIIERNINQITVVCNTNTWNAYNWYGGYSFYHIPKTINKNSKYLKNIYGCNAGNRSIVCNFRRPNPRINCEIKNSFFNEKKITDYKHLLISGESILWRFLMDNNYNFDIIIDRQLENIENIIDRKIIMLNTHPEYWSHKMLFNLNKSMMNKTNLIYLGGNGIWRKVLLKEDRIEKIGYPFCNTVTNKHISGIGNIDNFALKNPLNIEPYQLLGVFYEDRGHSRHEFETFICKNDSWIFKNTGIKVGDEFGTEYIWNQKPSGIETDKINHKYKKKKDNIIRPLLAKGKNDNLDGGDITTFEIYNSKVFSCGSICFTKCLIDPKVKKMIINVLDAFLSNF